MKLKIPKKILYILISLAIIIIITTFIKFEYFSDKFLHNGPLHYPPEVYAQSMSPDIKLNTKFLFGSLRFINNTSQKITVLSVEPTNVPSGVEFRVQGVIDGGTGGIGGMYYSELKKPELNFNIKHLPLNIPPKSKYNYQAIIMMSPKKTGKYTIQGLLITYKWKNKLYKEYYRDQFTVYGNTKKPGKVTVALPPEQWSSD